MSYRSKIIWSQIVSISGFKSAYLISEFQNIIMSVDLTKIEKNLCSVFNNRVCRVSEQRLELYRLKKGLCRDLRIHGLREAL